MLATGDKLKIYVESSLMCNETPMDLSFEPPMAQYAENLVTSYMPLLKSLIILLREESE